MRKDSVLINSFHARVILKTTVLPILAFMCAVIICAIFITVPDINDFRGLSKICQLMESNGWRYCVNVNWGFAHPLLNFLITKLTGDLLVSQRILSAVFGFFSILLTERIMTRILNVNKVRIKTLFLLWMSVSPWMLESIVSVHLDIAATVFILIGILMVKTDRAEWHVIAGFLVSIGSWFRFHYMSFAFFYPLLVAVYYWSDHKGKRALWTVIGVLLGLSVPAILCYSAFGVFSLSNQKLQFAMNTPDFSWSISYFQRLENLGMVDLIRQISWVGMSVRFVRICLRPEFSIFLVIIGLHLFSSHLFLRSKVNDVSSCSWIRTFTDIWQRPSAILSYYTIISLLPLLFIRGVELRHEIALFVIAFPVLSFIFSEDKNRYQVGLLLALILVSISMDSNFALKKLKRTKNLNTSAKEILSVVPDSILKQRPEKVFSSVEFYNPHYRYRNCSNVLTGGWGLLSESMKKIYGVMDIRHMHEDKDRLYELFEYIILLKKPPKKSIWTAYDKVMLSLDAKYHFTNKFVILHLNRRASRKK